MGALHEQILVVGRANDNNKQPQNVNTSPDSGADQRNNNNNVDSIISLELSHNNNNNNNNNNNQVNNEPTKEAMQTSGGAHQLSASDETSPSMDHNDNQMIVDKIDITRRKLNVNITDNNRQEDRMKLDLGHKLTIINTNNGIQLNDPRNNIERPNSQNNETNIKPTRKRFAILLMYIILQLIKSFQWICLASITNVAAKFYQVDNMAINWTTILFMVTFLVFALPISWLMEVFGLRWSVLIGSSGVTAGLIIKVFSCNQEGFWLSMVGHLIVGLAEPFFFSSYSQLSSIWFPDHQVASATSFALIGEAIGLSLGFIIPPLVVGSDPDNMEAIQRGLYNLFLVNAIISTLNTISIYLFFDNEPKFAPGIARFKQIRERRASQQGQQKPNIFQNIKQQVQQVQSLLMDKNFNLLLVGFGINVGAAYSIHTLLNQMIIGPTLEAGVEVLNSTLIGNLNLNATTTTTTTTMATNEMVSNTAIKLNNWGNEDPNLVVGNSGLILIVAGLFGSIACGWLLDRFHRYKLTTGSIYLITFVSMVVLTYCVTLESALILYLVTIPLGFAFTGYASCGFDYGVEITYPRPELLSATVLNISAQIFGIPISLIGSYIVDWYGSEALGIFFSLILLAGFLLTCLQGGDLKRQTAVNEHKTTNNTNTTTNVVQPLDLDG